MGISFPAKKLVIRASIAILGLSFVVGVLALFNTQYLFGYVDNKGHFVIPPRYVWADNFHDGMAKVDVATNKTCKGYISYTIDKKGNILSKDSGSEYSCKVLDIDFNNIAPGYAIGSDKFPAPTEDNTYTSTYKYGYKNKKNEWVILPRFSEAEHFNNDVAWVVPFESREKIWGLINKKGQYVLPPNCKSAGNFHEGLAFCRVKVTFGIFY